VADEPGLVSLTDELYARPPAEFVARRDELAGQARASGDRVLAARIKALRRPTVGAWYLNSAARARLAGLDDLIQLGHELRDAQSRGDFAALRELAARRGPLMNAVLRELVSHLAGIGVTATPAGLEEARGTLSSALADPDVAEELSRGRLDRPHVYGGFGELSGVVAASPARVPVDVEAEAAAAQQELTDAEAELAARTADRDAAEARARTAREAVEALAIELAEARAGLRAAEDELRGITDRQNEARKRVERAHRQVTSGPSSRA
jgi:hypothetical protein